MPLQGGFNFFASTCLISSSPNKILWVRPPGWFVECPREGKEGEAQQGEGALQLLVVLHPFKEVNSGLLSGDNNLLGVTGGVWFDDCLIIISGCNNSYVGHDSNVI